MFAKAYELERLKLPFAIVTIIIDLLSVTSTNGGGHIAHLGGAIIGYWFIARWEKGKDITAPINRLIDRIVTFCKPRPKIKISRSHTRHTTTRPETDAEYHTRKKKENEEIDIILDKIKKSGYSSLSTEEKKRLFEMGKK